jgi:hypothetical protein
VAELARVLAPGGRLRLRVPAAGPQAVVGPYNLYPYGADVTRRGRRPPETDELGWRRHYGLNELLRLLGPERFRLAAWQTSGVGAGELATLGGMLLYRWLRWDDGAYRRAERFVATAGEASERVPTGRFGTVLTVEGVRLAAEG